MHVSGVFYSLAISSAPFLFISAKKSPQTILLDVSPLSARSALVGLNLKILWGEHGGGKLLFEVKGFSSVFTSLSTQGSRGGGGRIRSCSRSSLMSSRLAWAT